MAINLLGTVLASPVVTGNYDTDTYGTHYSFLGIGGWQELEYLSDRDNIPVDALGNLDPTGLSSGRRRLGMLVYVAENDTTYQLYIPYNAFSGMTSSSKVNALSDNSNWVEFTAGGSGDAIKKKYLQINHGFIQGDVVSFNGTSYVKGIASAGNTYEFLGIVSNVIDDDNFVMTYSGFMDLSLVAGLSANTVYYVSPTISGGLTAIEPIGIGESVRPILITQEINKGLVLMTPSRIIDSSPTGTSNGLRTQNTFVQISNGFELGDVLKYSGTTFTKAVATTSAKDFPIGIVNKILNPDTFSITFNGYVDGMGGAFDYTGTKHLSGGTTYYLSPTVPGKLTSIRPTGSTHIVTPIYQAINTFDGIVNNQKGLPVTIPISAVSGLTAALNSKINSSLIGVPNGLPPLNNIGVIPIQYIPSGLKEAYVVPNIAARDAMFYVSGGTGTTGQTMSFRGLRVYVLNASGATGLPTGFTGTCEFIDTTGFLNWSATTGSVFINWEDVQHIPDLVNSISGGTAITFSNSGTGHTNANVLFDDVFVGITSGNSLTVKQSSIDKTRLHLQGNSGTTGQYLTLGTGNTINAKTLPATTIGPAEDGTYADGVFPDFTPSTPVGTAVDRFNELFLLVLPAQPAGLTSLNGTGTFASGNLSWGVSRNDIGYVNVGTNAGNPAVDINGAYNIGGTRLGMTKTNITGILNSAVVGNISGIPFFNGAFSKGDEGKLVMQRNGATVSTLVLSGTTGTTSNSRMSVSAVQFVKANSGSPVTVFKYRTGTYTFPVSGMTNGYNYIRIIHSGATFNTQTNFIEFVYDSDSSAITAIGTGLTSLSMSGSKTISGVKYHTSGSVNYQAVVSNVYKNVYSSLSNAIDFPNKENLGAVTNMTISGTGIIPRTGGTLQTLPLLNSGVSNPQSFAISLVATMLINSNIVLGNVGTTGRLRSGLSIAHPFPADQLSGGLSTLTGFLVYNITQGNVANSETFTGEVNRLQARDYSALTYSGVNAGTYAWDSTQSLIGVNTFHNTGMLVFNDELMYPNAAYLTTTYGITTGNFNAVTNTPASNVNYTSAAGVRDFYRKYTSANGATQSTLTFTIDHSGVAADFMTNGGTAGTPTGNNIKFEFLIMRSGGQIHGWANPFASTGNPEGIANTSISQVGAVMTVSCTLSTVPRVALGDIVIVRTFHSGTYSNRIRTLSITNI